MAGLGLANYPEAGDDGCGTALANLGMGHWKGTVPSGLLSQIEWAKCSLGERTGIIPFD
jgi:hypothetical protein